MSLDLGEMVGSIGADLTPLESALKVGDRTLAAFGASSEATAKETGRAIGAGISDEVTRLMAELPRNARGTVNQTSAEFRALPAAVRAELLRVESVMADQMAAAGARGGREAVDGVKDGLSGAKPAAEQAARESGKAFADRFSDEAKMAGKAAGAAVGVSLGVGIVDNINVDSGRRRLSAQLNLSQADAAEAGRLAGNVWSNNFGDDLGSVNDAVRLVIQNMNADLGSVDIQPAVEKVLTLADVFEQDLAMTTAAAGQLVRTGMAKDIAEALDMITVGLQGPANKADDLLETFNEYGTQFRKLGIDGATAVGLMNQGLLAGARDSDIVADALKEFAIRGTAGPKAVRLAFKALGIDAGEAVAAIAAGGPGASKMLDQVLDRLRKVKDPVKANAIVVELFGTQLEDLGGALGAMDVSKATRQTRDYAGAADEVVAKTGGGAQATIETYKRKLLQAGRSAIESTGPTAALAGAVAAFGPAVLGVLGPIATLIAARSVSTAAAVAGGGAEVAAHTATKSGWITSAAVAMSSAVRMAAAWLIAIGPIVLVVAAVAGLAFVIYKNWDKIQRWTGKAWDWVVDKVKKVPGAILGFFLNWTIAGLIIKHWDKIKSGTIRVAMATVEWVRGLPGRIVGAVAPLGARLFNSASNAWGRFRTGAAEKVGGLLNFVGGIPGKIVGKLSGIGGTLKDVGGDVVRGIWDGIMGMGNWLYDKLWDWIKDQIPGPVKKALGISSPSKVMAELAKWIPAGIAEGIDAGAPKVDAAVARMAGRVTGISMPAPPIGTGEISGRRPPGSGGAAAGGCDCGGKRPINVYDRSGSPVQTAKEVARIDAFAGVS